MSEQLRSILLGLSGLYLALIISFFLTVYKSPVQMEKGQRDNLINFFLLGISVQCFHFIEEYITGFYVRFPKFLGLSPWPAGFFVSFNLFWIAVWTASVIGIRRNYRAAYFPLWFFITGMILNLIAHPLLALANKGYFPGLFTSPLAGIMGIILLNKMIMTETREKV